MEVVKCISCNKKKIYYKKKKLCQACYSKEWRQTEKGKKYIKQYNATKGKICQKKYLEKKRKNKKPKKTIFCGCGKKAIAKNMCRNCYQKKYYRKNHKTKVRERREVNFDKIIELVNKGFTISNACKKLKYTRSELYKKITNEQKIKLKYAKTLQSKASNKYY